MAISISNSQTAICDDPRWFSITSRDPKADGMFFYSVRTTGVYCRPSCAARLPRPENVAFHFSTAEAEQAGFRPCLRCKPEQLSLAQQHAARISAVCRHIEQALEELSLNDLAAFAGMSPSHLHRVFRTITGLTPKRYAAGHRAKAIQRQLPESRTITEAIYDVGYNSDSRFYASSNIMLGMTPSTFRAGGRGVEIHFAVGQSKLGSILVAQSDRGICAILLGDDPLKLIHELEDRFPRASLVGGDSRYEQLVAQVVGFVEAPATGLDLPLDIRGTAFQQRVWQALRALPVGSTATYTDVAKALGLPRSVRAVAQACAANALAVAIPCHRVIRSDGTLSGYRWGLERKKLLLAREAEALLQRPKPSS